MLNTDKDLHDAVATALASAESSIATLPYDSPARGLVRTLAGLRGLFVCLRMGMPEDALPAVEARLRELCRSHGLPERVADLLLIADEDMPSTDGLSAAQPTATPTGNRREGPQQKRQSVPNNGRKD